MKSVHWWLSVLTVVTASGPANAGMLPEGLALSSLGAQQSDGPVHILLDQSPRAVEYQLSRLTNEELARVERRDDDPKYRLVYFALLTRKGLARTLRTEGLNGLTRIDRASPTQVLLDALSRISTDDEQTADALISMLIGQPSATLGSQRDLFMRITTADQPSAALRGAYTALMVADRSADGPWLAARQRSGHLTELLSGVRLLPTDASLDGLRASLAASIAGLLLDPPAGLEPAARAAAVRALDALPERAWPAARLEALAGALIALVRTTSPDQRTEPPAIDAMQVGERLAAALPESSRTAVRRELRALGVQVVKIETLPEQMQFSLKWFAAEAGKPLQIVLSNRDAMPHNLVLGAPGSLEQLGTMALTMTMPTDSALKPYVPQSPLVLQATNLVNEGDMARLSFTAPQQPGEYVFACTFPGHWTRMYGVMLVVASLPAWEATPTVPMDPMTKRPFTSQK